MNQQQESENNIPSVKRVQIQQLVIYDISQLDMEMLRRAALEPIEPPNTLDLTFSTFLLSLTVSAISVIIGLAATETIVQSWAYPVLGFTMIISLIAGTYFGLRYHNENQDFKNKKEERKIEVERLLEEVKNRPFPQGQAHTEAMHPAPQSRELPQ
jgi:hypothetical protein